MRWKWGWKQFLRVLVLGALGVVAVQIWLFSAETALISAERSQQWLDFLNQWARRLHLGIHLTSTSVRKLAHFAEFAALGFLRSFPLWSSIGLPCTPRCTACSSGFWWPWRTRRFNCSWTVVVRPFGMW